MDTNVRIKEALLPVFVDLIKNQCLKGGNKYALGNEREWTDLICEAFGTKEFILSNIMKYSGRIKNGDSRAPEDVIKIGTYAFLLWVKEYAEPPKPKPHKKHKRKKR